LKQNWARLKLGDDVDLASSAFGGKILKASNEHYGPAVQVISPFPPIHMFDGLESARSREKGHSEEVLIALAKPGVLHRIEIDFTFFVNNNPWELTIEGLTGERWVPLVAKAPVKAYAGGKIDFKITAKDVFSQVKVTAFPDGGMNRIKVYSKL
jgi:allantoicase